MATEVQWSELQRDPKGVAALADKGDVRVRRRDGAPLLLISEDAAESAAVGAISAARALRNALAHLPAEDGITVLTEEFSWLDVLPESDRRQFATDFARAVEASAELGRWSVLAQVVVEVLFSTRGCTISTRSARAIEPGRRRKQGSNRKSR